MNEYPILRYWRKACPQILKKKKNSLFTNYTAPLIAPCTNNALTESKDSEKVLEKKTLSSCSKETEGSRSSSTHQCGHTHAYISHFIPELYLSKILAFLAKMKFRGVNLFNLLRSEISQTIPYLVGFNT